MSYDYIRSREAARRLIERFGQSVTLRRAAKGTYDSIAGGYVGGSVSDQAVSAVTLDIDGAAADLLESGDLRVLVAADGLALVPAPPGTDRIDSLIIDGETYRIVGVRTVDPGGTAVIYEIQARR